MPNPSPHKARLAKKRQGRPGDLRALQALLWRTITTAERVLDSAEAELQLKAIHAISQASSVYIRLVEVGDIEPRIATLEAVQHGGMR